MPFISELRVTCRLNALYHKYFSRHFLLYNHGAIKLTWEINSDQILPLDLIKVLLIIPLISFTVIGKKKAPLIQVLVQNYCLYLAIMSL